MSRVYAGEDFNEIRRNLARINEEATPRCPGSPTRKLYDCLRSSSRCGDSCPYVNDWIGPEVEK